MEYVEIPLKELEPLLPHGISPASDGLVERVRTHGWDGIDPIPVVEVPEEHRLGGKNYCFMDGYHRFDAAGLVDSRTIPGLKYDRTDDPHEVSERTGGAELYDADTVIEFLLAIRAGYIKDLGITQQEFDEQKFKQRYTF